MPKGYETDGKITLNIGLSATAKLIIDNSKISFTARFGGNPHDIYIPITAVMGIYARENGEGMLFETLDDHNPEDDVPPKAKSEDRPSLKIVK